MRRRKHTLSLRCAHPGCAEYAHFEYDSIRERQRASENRREWKCVRHSSPDETLGAGNMARTCVLVNVRMPYGLFWREEGATVGGGGFVHGPGFQAFAADFPEGAKLTVTATVSPPARDPCMARGQDGSEGLLCMKPEGHEGRHRTGDGIEWAATRKDG